MSELKSFSSDRIYWAVEQVEREAGDIAELNLDDNLFYLKSEADKVIAELKHQRDGAFGLTNTGLSLEDLNQMARKVIAHHKYKRCLAMAKWCRVSARFDGSLDAFKYRDWYWKWFKRWLKIAEQFKEAS